MGVGGLNAEAQATFNDWLVLGKTIIILNGGNHSDLVALYKKFDDKRRHDYPYGFFNEDYASLHGAYTAVGIILPEKFATWEDRNEMLEVWASGEESVSNFDVEIIQILNDSHLA